MRDLIGRSLVRNTIFMMRQVERNKTVLIVEGDSDSRSLSRVIRSTHCMAFSPGHPGGKEQALALFDDLKQKKLPGVAALVDADCDRFWGRGRGHGDVCWTSCTDRETMIISSPAFDSFVADMFGVDPTDLRSRLMKTAFPLGCVRVTSRRHGWALDLKSVYVTRFIDANKITCDESACCREVLAKNPASGLSEQELSQAIRSIREKNPKPEDIVSGHDLTEILSLVSGSSLGCELSYAQIERQLSQRYEPAHFARTSTYAECTAWEGRNPPFVINI